MNPDTNMNTAGNTRPKHDIGLRVGLLSNPGSHRNRRAMPAIREWLRYQHHVVHCEAHTPTEIKACLSRLANEKLDVLAINGGDGTVQAALTSLFSDQPFASIPLLAIVPGGNTNMTAHDVGLRGGVKASLRRLCQWAQTGQPAPDAVWRPLVRVQANPNEMARVGMFFGAGVIVRGIQYCHRKVYALGLHDELAPGLATLRMLLAMARGDQRFTAPTPVGVGINSEKPGPPEDCLLLLVSTLERLFLGMHPYWGKQSAPLHYTWVRGAPKHPLRAFPALLRGRPNRYGTEKSGYRSANITALQLSMDGLFTLDGELYEAVSSLGPILIDHTNPVQFLRI